MAPHAEPVDRQAGLRFGIRVAVARALQDGGEGDERVRQHAAASLLLHRGEEEPSGARQARQLARVEVALDQNAVGSLPVCCQKCPCHHAPGPDSLPSPSP